MPSHSSTRTSPLKICAIGLRGIPDVMGGIETHCEQLYPRLALIGDKLDITVIGRSGYARAGRFENVRVVSLWAPRRKALETLVHTPLAILYARLFLHPHIIHLHAIGPGFFTPLARILGFRVLATHHAADYDRPKWGRFGRWFLKTGERMIARFADDVVCVSGAIEAGLAARHPARRDHFITIRNGVPLCVDTPVEGPGILAKLGLTPGGYVLAVGRLDASKGFHDLIAAFKQAALKGLKLVIAGAGPERDGYAAGLKTHASADVIFAGALPGAEVRTLFRHAALFVHPSYLEGFALVVLEAIAADCPLLVSRIPPHIEVGLEAACYFETGSVDEIASRLVAGSFDNLRARRRPEILAEGNWDRIAERHHAIIVRRGRPRKRPVAAPQEASAPAQ